MIELDLRSRLPIYEQLVERLKGQIISKVLEPNKKLQSVRSLAKELTINPNTIQKAYRELERQGYIYSIKGKGSFVSPSIKNSHSVKINDLKKSLIKTASELIFLGVSREEIYKSIDKININIGGLNNDNS